MKELKTKLLRSINYLPLIFLLFLTTFAHAQVLDKILVKVDDEIILKSELEVTYLQYLSQAEAAKVNEQELKCQILSSLMVNKLLLAKAETDSVVVDPNVVSEQLDQRMAYFIQAAGGEEKLVKMYNKTIDELKDDLRNSLEDQLVIQKMQDKITGGVKVTPGEVKKFYNTIPEDSLPYFSTEVEVGQIVRYPEAAKASRAKAKARLELIRQVVLEGADFCKLAKENSEDPGTKDRCGELGFFEKGMLVPEYEAAALRLKPGEISSVVESQYGYHLIQLIERRANEYNTRHILIKPGSDGVNYEETEELLDSLRQIILLDSLSFPKAAKDFSHDKATQVTNGFIMDQQSQSYRIPVDQLDFMLYKTIDQMNVGEISEPVRFKTEDGKEAVRIVYLKAKVPPHQANLKDDYQKILKAALEHKKSEILNDWFDENIQDVFIQVDEEYRDCNLLKAQ